MTERRSAGAPEAAPAGAGSPGGGSALAPGAEGGPPGAPAAGSAPGGRAAEAGPQAGSSGAAGAASQASSGAGSSASAGAAPSARSGAAYSAAPGAAARAAGTASSASGGGAARGAGAGAGGGAASVAGAATADGAGRLRRRLATAARRAAWQLRWQAGRLPDRAVARGLPPRLTGWRGIERLSPAEALAAEGRAGAREVLHPAAEHANPLPGNVARRDALDPDAGWWGYSMRDVPARRSAESYLAPLRDMRVLANRDGPKRVFTPAMIDAADRAVDMPQIVFRPGHAALLRRGLPEDRIESGIWILERAYDNHSHWLTAHLPKLVLLKSLGRVAEAILPAERGAAIDASLEMLGIDPAGMATFHPDRMLRVRELTVLVTDRFDPALLRPMRDAFRQPGAGAATRRVYISRARSRGRALANEDLLWPELRARGYERVFMEDLDFRAQVRLMNETSVMVAPHGAGITNMIFCPEGADIVEIADPGYPNPNFYALACAMSHRYWLVPATARGEGHALEKTLTADLPELTSVLERIDAARAGG